MSNPLWTDERLEAKRREGDSVHRWEGITFDDRIPLILEGPPLDEAISGLTHWLEAQRRNIETAQRIANTLAPVESGGVPPGATREPNPEIEQLIEAQNPQNDAIGRLSIGFLPGGATEFLDNARLASGVANYNLLNQNLDQAIAAMGWASAHMEQLLEQLQRINSDPKDPANPVNSDYLNAYNRFLEGVDSIRQTPDLLLTPDAFQMEMFNAYPDWFRSPFEPARCPHWLDEAALRTGVQLWQKDLVGILLVAFAHSLPACYLDKKGIPTLYQSERLLKQEFLAQRIYETAFFLNDVMQEDGFYVINDSAGEDLAWLAAAVHKAHPDWGFWLGRYLMAAWTDGHNTFRQADVMKLPEVERAYRTLKKTGERPEKFSAADLGVGSFPWLYRKIVRGFTLRAPFFAVGRYLWGPGFLAAVKVRYFHAQMRFFVESAALRRGATLPDTPINQEDLAYTLLTFGYVIPLGLEKLGCILTAAEKQAFLHLWRLVGYLLGIGDDLLTDDWDQAKVLYEKIKSRQQAHSDNGVKLTNALCTFVADLLPTWLPFRGAIAPVLIRDQMGADADDLFDATSKAASRNLVVRGCWAFVKNVLLRCYFLSRYLVFDRIGLARGSTDSSFRFMGEALIASWRQSYDRLPFDFTPGAKGFAANPDVSQAETKTEQKQGAVTRRKVFGWVAVGLGLRLLFHPIFWIGVASLILSLFSSAVWLGWIVKAMFSLCAIDVIGTVLVERRLVRLRNPADMPQLQF